MWAWAGQDLVPTVIDWAVSGVCRGRSPTDRISRFRLRCLVALALGCPLLLLLQTPHLVDALPEWLVRASVRKQTPTCVGRLGRCFCCAAML